MGQKKLEGKTWSYELSDKSRPLKTHIKYCLKRCDGDSKVLQRMLTNVVEHYKNNHANCDPESRCVKDPNYKPSRQIITTSFAEKLLLSVITDLDVYRNSQNYVYSMESGPVECFNNTLNVFQDKRVGAMAIQTYKMRSNLAVLHWNENQNHDKKKNTFQYRRSILNRLLGDQFCNEIWKPYQ